VVDREEALVVDREEALVGELEEALVEYAAIKEATQRGAALPQV